MDNISSGMEGRLFREIEHTSETGFIAEAGTLDELFVEAARALMNVITDASNVKLVNTKKVELEEETLEDLMHAWLEEINYLSQTESEFYGEFDVRIDGTKLEATISGEPIDTSKHELRSEVKAVTYGQYRLEKTSSGWMTRVILDI